MKLGRDLILRPRHGIEGRIKTHFSPMFDVQVRIDLTWRLTALDIPALHHEKFIKRHE